MSGIYRNDLEEALDRRRELLQKYQETETARQALRDCYARRASRILLGRYSLGMLAFVVCAVLVGYFCGDWKSYPPKDFFGGFVGAWILYVVLLFALPRILYRQALQKLTKKLAHHTTESEDVYKDLARLQKSPREFIRDELAAIEKKSVWWPIFSSLVVSFALCSCGCAVGILTLVEKQFEGSALRLPWSYWLVLLCCAVLVQAMFAYQLVQFGRLLLSRNLITIKISLEAGVVIRTADWNPGIPLAVGVFILPCGFFLLEKLQEASIPPVVRDSIMDNICLIGWFVFLALLAVFEMYAVRSLAKALQNERQILEAEKS